MGIDKELHPKDRLYNKYKVCDPKTGEEKEGFYFCLRLDTKDPLEHKAVTEAILAYAKEKISQGFKNFAVDLVKYVNGTRVVPTGAQ